MERLKAERISIDSAARLIAVGVPRTAEAIINWHGIAPSDVLEAAERGFSSGRDFREFGSTAINGETLRLLREFGCQTEREILAAFAMVGEGLEPQLAATWVKCGIPLHEISSWIVSGMPPAEASQWHRSGVAPDSASLRRRSGLVPPPSDVAW